MALETMEMVLKEVKSLKDIWHPRGLVLAKQAADYLTLSPRQFHTVVMAGKIKRVTLSPGRFAYRIEELDRYARENEAFVTKSADDQWLEAALN